MSEVDNLKQTDSIANAASKGGIARRNALTPAARTEIARNAVLKRWEKEGKPVPLVAKFGAPDRPLRIGTVEIPCYVLSDGTRLLAQRGLQSGIGMSEGGGQGGARKIAAFMARLAAKGIDTKGLVARVNSPINFMPPRGGNPAHGYEATILPDICAVIIDADQKGKLDPRLKRLAERAALLQHGFSTVGIIALVDEATGYQYERPRRDLEQYLKKFLADSLVRWARTFPNDYFKHLCRLKGVQLRPDMRLPQYFGHLTNDLVYRRIAPGLLKALKERRVERGRPSNKLYWWTSEDLGHPELLLHLGTVVGLMKIHTDYDKFHAQLDVVAPVFPEYPGLFDDPADWDQRTI